MTKRLLLLSLVLGGMLLSNARTMFAPPLKDASFANGQDPLASARDSLINQRTQAMRRSLTAILSTDAGGKHPTASFTQNDKRIFLVWQERAGAKGDRIRVSWVAEAVDRLPKSRQLGEEVEILPGDGPFISSFYLSPANASLPAGTYRANLYKNSTLVRALKFTVEQRPAKT